MLQVCLSSQVSSAGFEALSKLRLLRQFLFGETINDKWNWEIEKNFLVLCWQILPQLKAAGRRFDVLGMEDQWTFFRSTQSFGPCRNHYHNHLVQQPQLTELGLEDLYLSWEVQPHEHLKLPELKSLSLIGPAGDVLSLCERFPTITALALIWPLLHIKLEVIMKVLQKIGRRLNSLVLKNIGSIYDMTFSLYEVLELCPNLERLMISLCYTSDATHIWPKRFFDCLEEVHFHKCEQLLPPGFVMQVNIFTNENTCLFKNSFAFVMPFELKIK